MQHIEQYKNTPPDAIISIMSEDHDAFYRAFNTKQKKDALAPQDFDIIVDQKTGKIWVIHDKEFLNQGLITEATYNRKKNRLRFATRDGSIQYLGARVQKPLIPYLEKAKEIVAILTDKDGNIKNMFSVPLKQKNTEENE